MTDGLAGTQRLLDVEAAGHRLALELECMLLDTKDLPTVSRWWESGMQALEEWQRMFPYNGPRLGGGLRWGSSMAWCCGCRSRR